MQTLSSILKRLVFFIIALLAVIVILDYSNISFTSDAARHALLKQISTQTGHDVRIDGEVKITVSLLPEILVEKIHIRNPDGFAIEDFISVSSVYIKVPLLPLLSGQFHLQEIAAEQARINLIQKKDGINNWSPNHAGSAAEVSRNMQDREKQDKVNRWSLGIFSLTDIIILYKNESHEQTIRKHFEHLTLDITDQAHPHIEITGSIQGAPYDISFESDPFQALESGQSWTLQGKGKIAGSRISISADSQIINHAINSTIDINIEDPDLSLTLEKLGFIAGMQVTARKASIKAKLHGSNLAELYEKADISLQLLAGHWTLSRPRGDSANTAGKVLDFNKISSSISWNNAVEFHLDGTISGEAIIADFKTNRFLAFFDELHQLDIDINSTIADASINLTGTLDLPVNTKQFELDLSLKGKDLERLSPVFDIQFPAFNDYSLTGKLVANKKGFIIRSAKAVVGHSQMQGSVVIDTVSNKPLWSINFSSQQIQLNDFSLDGLTVPTAGNNTANTSKQATDKLAALKPVHRLIEIMRTPETHLNINMKADRVLAGDEVVGKIRFQLHLRDNSLSLTNADIEIPAGRVTASMSFQLEGDRLNGDVELKTDRFDYGIAARMFNPESELAGVISIHTDLRISGSDYIRLLDNATGKLDIAIWPKNTKPAKILNLWATNLYLLLLPELKKKESKVNCLVGLMDLKDGIMQEELFAIDTTRLWINGNARVDFKRQHVELTLFPHSKTARFFALQTPIRTHGSFSKIRMEINPVDIAGAYLSFITSPLHVPARWLFTDKPPEDGSAICEKFFDRKHLEKIKEEILRKEQEDIEEYFNSD